MQLLRPQLEDILFLGQSYEMLFDEFEIFAALEFLDAMDHNWTLLGRYAWKYSNPTSADNPFGELIEKAKKSGETWLPLKAGFFGGSYSRFEKAADTMQKQLAQLHLW